MTFPVSSAEFDAMRRAGRVVGRLLKAIGSEIKPGVRTIGLDRFAEEFILEEGALPAFKGYRGYPATVCLSINEEVVHGIPGPRVLKEGDIVGVDVGAVVDGFYGDAARTFAVGAIDKEKTLLIQAAKEGLDAGIRAVVIGNRVSDISNAVQTSVEKFGFSVVRQYSGHGIGSQLHEDPQIPNFGPPHKGPLIEPGMALAIEPMVNAGTFEVVVAKDDWTVLTKDGRPSSHFEHTVLVTKKGREVLTLDA